MRKTSSLSRSGIVITEALIVAVITLLTTIIADKESDGAITKIIYLDMNSTENEKCYKLSTNMLK